MTERWLSVEEISEYLGVSKDTVYTWRNKKGLPAHRIGRLSHSIRPFQFPRWLRCVKCGLLSEYDTGLFEIKENRYRPEQTRFVHKDCKGSKGDQPSKDADAVPARFLLAWHPRWIGRLR